MSLTSYFSCVYSRQSYPVLAWYCMHDNPCQQGHEVVATLLQTRVAQEHLLALPYRLKWSLRTLMRTGKNHTDQIEKLVQTHLTIKQGTMFFTTTLTTVTDAEGKLTTVCLVLV